jgi:hypothetical protein
MMVGHDAWCPQCPETEPTGRSVGSEWLRLFVMCSIVAEWNQGDVGTKVLVRGEIGPCLGRPDV